jgi:hypothetical protein
MIARQVDLEVLECAGFMTEYDSGSDNTDLLPAADYFMQSWIKWEYKEFIRTYKSSSFY